MRVIKEGNARDREDLLLRQVYHSKRPYSRGTRLIAQTKTQNASSVAIAGKTYGLR
jgi:hypothetical protein